MKIEELQDGQVVRARWGRAGREDVNWGEWLEVPLSIQRNKKGKVALITLKDVSWAEYTPRDFSSASGVFLVEDWYLEVEGLEK